MKKIVFLSICICIVPTALFADEGIVSSEESTASPFSQSKFLPDISLILDISYNHFSCTNEDLAKIFRPGFTPIPAQELQHGHAKAYPENGFSFNYAEITFYSIVDPYFDLFTVCKFAENNASIEEAYFTTRALPLGFQLKAGKFLSGFGRLNEQHDHFWSFADMPLVHLAFFGESGLREIGARISWVAPTDFMLTLAFEILRGENQQSFGTEKIVRIDGSILKESKNKPNLFIGNIRTSFDIGDLVVLLGSSAAFGETRINHGIEQSGKEGSALAGKTYLLGCDITLKYIIDSIRSIAFQSEYLHRNMKGDEYINYSNDVMTSTELWKRQSGFYAQLVGKLSKRWSAGGRFDLLQKNSITKNGIAFEVPENLSRYSGMIEYNPTEFSRFRIQYSLDKSNYAPEAGGYEKKTNHEIIVQANLAIGAHGAHSF